MYIDEKYSIAFFEEFINITCPCIISINWSNWWNASELGWWIVHITVLPDNARFCKTSTTCWAVNESSPVVGSSKNIKLGSVISSTPIDVRLRSPPDTPFTSGPPIFVSAAFSRPRLMISLSTTSLWFESGGSFIRAANSRHSRTVSICSNTSSCCTYPTYFAKSILLRSTPLTSTSPCLSRLLLGSLPER